MNKVILMGRLTRDPEVRYSAGENALAIARYTLAVDRRFRRDGEASADFNVSMLSSVYATSVLFTRASAAAITSSALCASVVFVIVKSSAYLFPL